jgi:hypothetical protein
VPAGAVNVIPQLHSTLLSPLLAQRGSAPAAPQDLPLRFGAVLPDVTLQGPLDLLLSQPIPLDLFLPYPSFVDGVKRVVLREGASVTVRGARSMDLQRPLDLPSVGLGAFAEIVMADTGQLSAAGIMHLATGLREAAVRAANASSAPATTPSLVAIKVEMATEGAALLAAAGELGRRLQRLKVRRLAEGAIELSAKGELLADDSRAAVVSAGGEGGPYVWPLRSVSPWQLNQYESLLREVLSSRLFSQQPRSEVEVAVRPVGQLPLRLMRTAAEAVTLVRMQMVLDRDLPEHSRGGEGEEAGKELPVAGSLTDVLVLGSQGVPRRSGSELWEVVVEVSGDARRGLHVKPLHLQQVSRGADTVAFAPDFIGRLMDGNYTY